ncbi:MAG: hypothetical protein ACK48D_15345 [Pseudanabaena sp.]
MDTDIDFLRLLLLDCESRREYLPKHMPLMRIDYGQLYFETSSPLQLAFAWARESLPYFKELDSVNRADFAALYSILDTTLEFFSDLDFDRLSVCESEDVWGYCGLWIVLRHYAKALLDQLRTPIKYPSLSFNDNFIQSGFGVAIKDKIA